MSKRKIVKEDSSDFNTISDTQYKEIFKEIPLPGYIWRWVDDDFILIDHNDAATSITNGKIVNFVGIKARDLFKNQPEIQQDIAFCFFEKKTFEKNMPYKYTSTGMNKFLSVKYSYMHPDLVIVFTSDISQFKTAEIIYQDAEKKYESFLEKSFDGIMIFKDLPRQLLYINNSFAKMLGYRLNELTTFPFSKIVELFNPSDSLVFNQIFSTSLINLTFVKEKEIRGYKKDGSIVWFSIIFNQIYYKSNQAILCVFKDITHQISTEESLHKSEETAHALLNASSDIQLLLNKDFDIIELNEAAAKFLKKPIAKLIGKNPLDFIPPDVSIAREEKLIAAVKTKKTQYIDDTRDGKWFSSTIYPILNQKGNVSRIAITSRDITEKKHTNLRIKESEEKYRSIVELTPDGIITLDFEGIAQSCNSAFLRLIESNRSEIIGQHFKDLPTIKPSDVKSFEEIFSKIKKGNIPGPLIIEGILKDGSQCLREVRISRIKTGNKFSGIQVIMRDVTEQKRAESALKKSEEKFRWLYEENPSIYFKIDLNGIILSVNEFGAAQLGYSVSELVGKSLHQICYEDDAEKAKAFLASFIEQQKETVEWQFRRIKKDGTILFVKENVRSVKMTDETTVILVISEDVTDKVAALKEKDQLLNQLSQAEKMVTLGQMAATVAHEINNPLDIISTKIYLLRKQLISYDSGNIALEYLKNIEVQINRLTILAKNILNFARPLSSIFRPVNIPGIIKMVINNLPFNPNNPIKLIKQVGDEDCIVEGDKIGLELVFKNIILNSLQASKTDSQILISTTLNNNQTVNIKISDNGHGITQREKTKIFEPFYTTRRSQNGTGLGLAITKRIIDQHHGKIKVKSVPNVGTTVNILLPVSHN